MSYTTQVFIYMYHNSTLKPAAQFSSSVVNKYVMFLSDIFSLCCYKLFSEAYIILHGNIACKTTLIKCLDPEDTF